MVIFGDDDSEIIKGTPFDDVIFGEDGYDRLNGGEGNDVLFDLDGAFLTGANGDDTLIGAGILSGGDGHDTFVFGHGQIARYAKISDFVIGEDHLDLGGLAVARIYDARPGVRVTLDDGTLLVFQHHQARDLAAIFAS